MRILLSALFLICLSALSSAAAIKSNKLFYIDEVRAILDLPNEEVGNLDLSIQIVGDATVEIKIPNSVLVAQTGSVKYTRKAAENNLKYFTQVDPKNYPALYLNAKKRSPQDSISIKAMHVSLISNGVVFGTYKLEKLFLTESTSEIFLLERILPNLSTKTESYSTESIRASAAGLPSIEVAADARFKTNLWSPGSIINVAFKGGSESLNNSIVELASRWTNNYNIEFFFGESNALTSKIESFNSWSNEKNDFDVRIEFREEDSPWSACGLENRLVAKGEATMNVPFNSIENDSQRQTVLQLFGRAIGLPWVVKHPKANVDIRWEDEIGYNPNIDVNENLVRGDGGKHPGLYRLYRNTREEVDGTFRPSYDSWTPLVPTADSVLMHNLPHYVLLNEKSSKWYKDHAYVDLGSYDHALMEMLYPKEDSGTDYLSDIASARQSEASEVNNIQIPTSTVDQLQSEGWRRITASPRDLELPRYPLKYQHNKEMSKHQVGRIQADVDFSHPSLGDLREEQYFGTAIIVGISYIITCNHVIPNNDVAQNSVFSVQLINAGMDILRFENNAFLCGSESLDYSVLKVKGTPGSGSEHGMYLLQTSEDRKDSLYDGVERHINILHYPGNLEYMSQETNAVQKNWIHDKYLAYVATTSGGSSGGGVYDNNWTLLGLHRFGGDDERIDVQEDSIPKLRKATRIDKIIQDIKSQNPEVARLLNLLH